MKITFRLLIIFGLCLSMASASFCTTTAPEISIDDLADELRVLFSEYEEEGASDSEEEGASDNEEELAPIDYANLVDKIQKLTKGSLLNAVRQAYAKITAGLDSHNPKDVLYYTLIWRLKKPFYIAAFRDNEQACIEAITALRAMNPSDSTDVIEALKATVETDDSINIPDDLRRLIMAS